MLVNTVSDEEWWWIIELAVLRDGCIVHNVLSQNNYFISASFMTTIIMYTE